MNKKLIKQFFLLNIRIYFRNFYKKKIFAEKLIKKRLIIIKLI